MRIARLTIKNVLGLEDLDFKAGKFNLITGGNAAGKTSILDAIKAAVGGGHDAHLVRKGAEKGEIVLVLDDDGQELVLRKTITEAGSRPSLLVRDGAEIPKPQAFLNAIHDAISANPIGFLTAPAKQKAQILLEALPMTVTPEDIRQATGMECTEASTKGHALDVIETVRVSIFDERTGVNRAAKEKRATVKQLSESLPPAPEGDPEAELAKVRREQGVLSLHHSQERERLAKECRRLIDRATEAYQAAVRQAEEIRRATIQAANEEYNKAVDEIEAKMKPAITQLATREEQALQLVRAAGARSTMEQLKGEAEKLEDKSGELTLALDKLEALKGRLLAKLPIPGLEYRDKEFFYGGVALEHVNKAEQIKIALAVSRLRVGKLGFVCVDGIEALDPEQRELFHQGALKSGLQYFITAVTGGPLKVSVDNA